MVFDSAAHRRMLGKMKLKLNEEKSRMVKAYEESFDFLGHTFRYSRNLHGRSRKYLNIEPSKKSQKKVKTKIREYLKKSGHKPPQLVAKEHKRQDKLFYNKECNISSEIEAKLTLLPRSLFNEHEYI